MHDADFLSVVRRASRRFEGKVDLLHDRQRVHVGAKADDAPWFSAPKNAADAGVRDGRTHFDAELSEPIGDQLRRPKLAVAELGMLMDVAAALDHFRLDGFRRVVDPLVQSHADCHGHQNHRFGIAPRSASAFSTSSPNHSAKCGSFFSSARALVRVAISRNCSTNPRKSSATPRSMRVVDWSSMAFSACSACAYSLLKYSKFCRASSERSSDLSSVMVAPVRGGRSWIELRPSEPRTGFYESSRHPARDRRP